MSCRSRPDLAEGSPLELTYVKLLHSCRIPHRQIATLRGHVTDPQVELHPDAAAAHGIA